MTDRATFAVTLVARLRRVGVAAEVGDAAAFLRALEAMPRADLRATYLVARATLVHRHEDLVLFDSIFGSAAVELTADGVSEEPGASAPVPRTADATAGGTLPWLTPRAVGLHATTTAEATHAVPIRRPLPDPSLQDLPFDALSAEQIRQLGLWLVRRAGGWPMRRSRRRTAGRGSPIDLRATLRAARRTGWEPVVLRGSARRSRPRRVVAVCDVSRSMQADIVPLLYLMRALGQAGPAEVFAAGTSLTRLSAVLRAGTPSDGVAAAGARIDDRLGGTRLAASLSTLLEPPRESLVRGAVLVIASDGWDSAEPAALARVMERLHRRAHRVIWANPRASADGFAPRVATLAAALDHCDEMRPAGTFSDLAGVFATFCNAKM